MRPWELGLIAIYAAGVVVLGTTDLDERVPGPLAWAWLLGGPFAAGYAIGRPVAVALALLWPAIGWIGESDDAPAWQTAVLVMFPAAAALLLGGAMVRQSAAD